MIEKPILTPATFSSIDNLREVLKRIRHKYQTHQNPKNTATLSSQQYRDYFKFTFVRNPWARVFSAYSNIMMDPVQRSRWRLPSDTTLYHFLRLRYPRGLLKPQVYWIKDFQDKIPLDFIGRFERIHHDFNHLCKALGIPPKSLPHEVRGPQANYQDQYNSETIELVAKLYWEDIEVFNYTFDK